MTLASLLDSLDWSGLSLEGDESSTPPASPAQPAPALTNPVAILCELRRLGVEPGLSRKGMPVLTGVSILDPEARAQVLAMVREHRAAIVATLRQAEQAFETIKFSVEHGLLCVWPHPSGATFADLDAVEARFGFDARRFAAELWDQAWPVRVQRTGELLKQIQTASGPAGARAGGNGNG